ncbi:MAG: WD40 repeat domain-containing protein, partial [Solirubrobacteraceae bacterium]
VVFSPDGTRVATGGFSGAVRLWDARTGAALARIAVSAQPLASVRFSRDGSRIVTGSFDGMIHLFALRERGMLAAISGHKGAAMADFISGSAALVSAGQEDRTLRTLAPPAARLSPSPGKAPRFGRDGRRVVSGDVTGAVHVWNPATGADRTFTGHTKESVPQFSPDGRQIVSASFDGTVRLWDAASGRSRLVPTLAGSKAAAAIDPTGERIAIGGDTPLVIQSPDGTRRLRLKAPRGLVAALVFSPDARHLLTGHYDGTARIWDARSGALERTLSGHQGIVRGVSYSNDGRRIATAGGDGTVRVWSAEDGGAVILVGHEDAVNTAEFDDSGDRVVSAGDDGTIRVWDAAGGEALALLYQHEGIASGADFGDGRDVVSAGDDGVRITPCEVCASIAQTLRLARTRARHELGPAERRLLPGG